MKKHGDTMMIAKDNMGGPDQKPKISQTNAPRKGKKKSGSTKKCTTTISKGGKKAGTFSREKGKRGERDATNYLKGLGFNAARTSMSQCQIQIPHSDVSIVGHTIGIEVKFDGNIELGSKALERALIQAARVVPMNKACVLWRKSRCKWNLTFNSFYGGDDIIITVSGERAIKHCINVIIKRPVGECT